MSLSPMENAFYDQPPELTLSLTTILEKIPKYLILIECLETLVYPTLMAVLTVIAHQLSLLTNKFEPNLASFPSNPIAIVAVHALKLEIRLHGHQTPLQPPWTPQQNSPNIYRCRFSVFGRFLYHSLIDPSMRTNNISR